MGNYSYQGSMFPQPQGSLYILNNSMDVGNVPMSSGVSAVICPNESLLYLKSMTNGSPAIVAYTLVPYEPPKPQSNNEFSERLGNLEKQIEEIRSILSGGKLKNEL